MGLTKKVKLEVDSDSVKSLVEKLEKLTTNLEAATEAYVESAKKAEAAAKELQKAVDRASNERRRPIIRNR